MATKKAMAKKKAAGKKTAGKVSKKTTVTVSSSDKIDELVKLADELGLPVGAFDGDLHDTAEEEAELIYEDMRERSLQEQLLFLFEHGYQLDRLEDLVREFAESGGYPHRGD